MKLKLFTKENEKPVTIPLKKRSSDAGWDCYLPRDVIFKAHELTTVDMGFGVSLPEGFAGLFAMRSSVCKTGMIIEAPLIDQGYLGELHLLVYNPTDTDFSYKRDDRVCSLFVFPVYSDVFEIVSDLGTSDRGTAWNGSSGK